MSARFRALIAALALLCAATPPALAQWTRMNGPTPPPASALAPHAGRWFMGTDYADQGDVFVSDDDGATWTDAGLPNGGVACMLSHGGTLFVGTYLGGLQRSDDAGASWTPVGAPLNSATVEAVLPVNASTLIAGVDPFFPAPLYRSDDAGATWAAIPGGPMLRCWDLAQVGGVQLAGGEDAGVYRSANGGVTWTPANVGLPASCDAQRFAVDGGTVYLAAENVGIAMAVYRSDDLGLSWTTVSADLPTSIGDQATQLVANGGALYLATDGTFGARGLYRSVDGGVHWTLLTATLPSGAPGVRALAFVDGDLVVGTFDGVFRSGDDGATWTASWQGSSGICGGQAALWTGARLLVGNDVSALTNDNVQSTADGGLTWQGATGPAATATARDFLLRDGIVYAALYGATRGVSASFDGGLSFASVGVGMASGTVLQCLHASGDALLAGDFDGLYRSEDDGATWQFQSTPGPVSDLATHDGRLYASLYPGGVAVSDDDGVSWTPVGSLPGLHVNAVASFGGSVYAALNSSTGVQRWDGSAWVGTGCPADFPDALLEVDGALVVGSAFGELYVSTDGATWDDWTANYTGGLIESLAATADDVLVASRSRGFWTRPRSDLPGATAVEAAAPTPALALGAAPNPFNPSTTLRLQLERAGHLRLDIVDVNGRRVRRLLDRAVDAGPLAVDWDGRDDAGQTVATGVYLARARTAAAGVSVKLVLLQ